ncbi:MAG: hypothetical protein HONBIEJF_01249 [Fimbriimonadaceae bacterium]|nr:hypothetical protein [Fimbriimonadaceae bacterium]
MSILKKPIFWVGVLAVGGIGYMATEGEAKKPNVVPKVATRKVSTSKKASAFTDEDRKAQFAPVNITFKNAFQPIVARKSGGFGSGEGSANGLPTDFTGGVAGWIYTGSAEIDGVAMALLENRTTGEGVFLKSGERWKSAAVVSIYPDSVVMRGPSGTKTFSVVNDLPNSRTNSSTPLRPNVPQNLQGDIRRGRDMMTMSPGSFSMSPDSAMPMPQGGGMPPIIISPSVEGQ